MAVEKPPVSRRLAVFVTAVILFAATIGAIFSLVVKNPEAEKIEREQKEREKQIEDQRAAELQKLDAQIRQREEEIARRERQEELRRREEEIKEGARTMLEQSKIPPKAPEIDPSLLAALEEADRLAGQRPAISLGSGRTLNDGSARGSAGGEAASIGVAFEAYDRSRSVPSLGEALGQEPRRQRGEKPELKSEYFETSVPKLPPSNRIVSQGAQIRAVLLSRIDTRNPGNVIAQVTSDVYDSTSAEVLLIPKGARLLGEYATSISPGNHRLAIAFTRLMLPDGRAVDLGGMQATGNDGVVGVQGQYHGNLARAIGPALMTAILGAAIEEETRPDQPQVEPGVGGTVQSPTVIQQVAPKITDAVLERYKGARPYVTAEPGQAIKVLVTADIEIPEWSEG